MKPKYLCSECGHALRWEDRFCGSCGKPVEWPGEAKGAGKVARAKGDKSGSLLGGSTGKWAAALVAGVVGSAVLFEVLNTSKSLPAPQQSAAAPQQATSANMEALPQIEALEKQLNQNQQDAAVRLKLANLLQDSRFFDKAIAQYLKYLEAHPDDPDARVDLGICYNDIGNFTEAERNMKAVVEKNPRHVLGHLNLGIINLQAGNLEEANRWFRKTVELAPNSTAGQRAQQLLTQHANMTNPQPN